MKSKILLLGLLALILASCQPSVFPAIKSPRQAQVSGARGLYLKTEAGSKAVRDRVLVTATAATLGLVTSTGLPQDATFLDDSSATVDLTINKAAELDTDYILFEASYSGTDATFAMSRISGALAAIAKTPDNWKNVCASGSIAWWVNSGAIYKIDLTSGASTVVSSTWPMWDVTNFSTQPQEKPVFSTGTSSWSDDTWLYVDAGNSLYALYAPNNLYFQALCVKADGTQIDFANNYDSWRFYLGIPGMAETVANVARDVNGNIYILKCQQDNTQTYCILSSYAVTLDPSSTGVLHMGTTPVATSNGVSSWPWLGKIGKGISAETNVWSDGVDTWKVGTGGILTRYDTSAVPVANNNGNGYITSWQYSGGNIYAGPCSSSPAVNLVEFLTAPAVSDPPLVDGATSWSVSGDTLFWTDASGSWYAPINTSTGTIGAKSAYSGQVQTITQ